MAPKDPHMQLVDRRISNVRDLLECVPKSGRPLPMLSKDVEGLAILVSCGRPVEAVSNARTALAHVSTPRKEDPGRSWEQRQNGTAPLPRRNGAKETLCTFSS